MSYTNLPAYKDYLKLNQDKTNYFDLDVSLQNNLQFLLDYRTKIYCDDFDFTTMLIEIRDLKQKHAASGVEMASSPIFNETNTVNYVTSGTEQKLYYPEPYIASPSFLHEEIWFIHILHYQYWLWFFFISLIMFYFVTFINVVRWCNLRSKPKRETRGVSRSKCADLITACVPVSWAISIIISETVDAADYYDGFGSGEVIIGIRAYQWGWEYFYPKSLDLQYRVRPSFSSLTGNSLKYNTSSSHHLDTNVLWKFYQKKSASGYVNTPASLLISPTDKDLNVNTNDFSFIGNNVSHDSLAFSKIHRFNKVPNSAVINSSTNDTLTLERLSNLYLTPSKSSAKTYQYGSSRQHNFSSLNTVLPSFSTLLDYTSFTKFFNFSFDVSLPNSFKLHYNEVLNLNTAGTPSADYVGNSTMLIALSEIVRGGKPYIDGLLNNSHLSLSSKYCFLASFLLKSEEVQNTENLLSKSAHLKKTNHSSTVSTIYTDLTLTPKRDFQTQNIFLEPIIYLNKDLKHPNTQFLSSDKNIRGTAGVDLTKGDFDATNKRVLTTWWNQLYSSHSPAVLYFLKTKANLLNIKTLDSSLKSHRTFTSTYNPLSSQSLVWDSFGFDKLNKYSTEDTPALLRGKEDVTPEYIFDTYWSSYYNNITLSHRYPCVANYIISTYNSYFHLPLRYAEYDFKNLQALEDLEDAFWEATQPTFAQLDYLDIKTNTLTTEYFNKQQVVYNSLDRSNIKHLEASEASNTNESSTKVDETSSKPVIRFKGSKLYKPLSLAPSADAHSVGFTLDNLFYSPLNLLSYDLAFVPTELLTDNLDDTYESLKASSIIFPSLDTPTLLTATGFNTPKSFTSVVDAFRSDFDENVWDTSSSYDIDNQTIFSGKALPSLSNNLKLRTTTKNSLVTFNAIQKVYKSRFDDLRSNTKFTDFASSFSNYPFIIESKTPYESMLKKNKEVFYNTNFYNVNFNTNYSTLSSIFSSLNTKISDIPFLLSLKSDASRYFWFDWQARWSSIEVQPASIAKFSLAGLPYASKKYEYTLSLGDELNDSETYLNRVSRARKNFLPNWAYSTFFFAKTTSWFFNQNDAFWFQSNSTKTIKFLLNNSKAFWSDSKTGAIKNINISKRFIPTYSNLNRPNVITWSPLRSVASYHYHTSVLCDILTKREYLYRTFFASKTGSINVPKYCISAPNSTFVPDLMSTYSFLDPSTYGSEVTRELLYGHIGFLHHLILVDFLKLTNKLSSNLPINFSLIGNYFIHLDQLRSAVVDLRSKSVNTDLYKSQYRPMRKGISNMIRLQATNAVAMPTEIRLHILASSKDVIHSWAIPSAGIKIDCVPGFSSHRVAIFLQHGIFWGQCMEICGRYHHWMPIVVYFMKRDLFFLWCIHFMHYSDTTHTFNMNDRQLADYLRLVSFDKTTWANEFKRLVL